MKRFFAAALAISTCLLVQIGAAAQAPAPQAGADKVPLTDDVFKSVQILKIRASHGNIGGEVRSARVAVTVSALA